MDRPSKPPRKPGSYHGEQRATTDHEGREGDRRIERDSTSINPEARRPILPGMPDLPPA